MTCNQLLNHLLNGYLIKLREVRPPLMPLPPCYDINAWCELHTGAPGHSIDNRKTFRLKVQYLFDSKSILSGPTGPNVNNNMMPLHAIHPINMIQEYVEFNRISEVDMLNTHPLGVKEHFLLKNVFPECTSNHSHCLSNPHGCGELKKVSSY